MIIVHVHCDGIPSTGLQFHRLCRCELRDEKKASKAIHNFPGKSANITIYYRDYDPGRDQALKHADDFLNGRMEQARLGEWL